MKYLLFILILISTLACKEKSNKTVNSLTSVIPRHSTIKNLEEFEYVFTDSITHEGVNNIYKFVIGKYQGLFIDTLYIETTLYRKDKNKWILLQSEREETTLLNTLDTDVLDLNNDGFMDLLYTSGAAARGANRVNSCIIYKPKEEKFVHLHNAPNYPSISYNKKLRCIDSQAIYGGSTTSFLRIQGDSLFCFAEISLFGNERYFTRYLLDGIQKTILQDTLGIFNLSYYRFSDYHLKEALKEYEKAKTEFELDNAS